MIGGASNRRMFSKGCNMGKFKLAFCASIAAIAAQPAAAQVVTTDANDLAVARTQPNSPLAQAVGTAAIANGLDFSFGNAEGVFADNAEVDAICGINASGRCDLLTAVDGRIVLLGSTDQGFTNFFSAEAGISEEGALLLEVFGIDNGLLGSLSFTNAILGPNGRGTASITRSAFDIAFFRISGADSFGVNLISIETPTGGIPEPATWGLMILGIGAVGGAMRLRRRRTTMRFA